MAEFQDLIYSERMKDLWIDIQTFLLAIVMSSCLQQLHEPNLSDSLILRVGAINQGSYFIGKDIIVMFLHIFFTAYQLP